MKKNYPIIQLSNYPINFHLGFTLMELLVVISIIAILVTIGLSSFATAQKKGRDARRKGDLTSLSNALEQYYSVCGFLYPTPAGNFYGPVICTTPGVSIAIMPTGVSDPRGLTSYYCPAPATSNCTSTAYTACGVLESETPNTFCIMNTQ